VRSTLTGLLTALAPDPIVEPGADQGVGLLRQLIGRTDHIVRWWHGVHDLSKRDDCLLRIAFAQITEAVRLSDGSLIPPDTVAIDLHLWNERLRLLPPLCHGLRRAVALRRHMRASLEELARRCECGELADNIVAIRAQAALVPKRRIGKLLRVAAAFGLVPAVNASTRPGRPLGRPLCQSVFIFALAWTFNPATLQRNGWQREPCVLWMSRAALVSTHGCAAKRAQVARTSLARPPQPGDCANPNADHATVARCATGIAAQNAAFGRVITTSSGGHHAVRWSYRRRNRE